MANSQINFIKFYNNQKYIFMKQNHIRLVKYYKYLFIQIIKKIYSFYLFLPSSSLFSLYLTNILIISVIIFFFQLIIFYYIFFLTLIIYI